MDGLNVNHKMLPDFKEELNETHDDTDPLFSDISSCVLRALHNTFKISIKTLS